MKKFSITLSDRIPSLTKIKIFELCKNGKNLFAEFSDEVKDDPNLFSDYAGAMRILQDVANLMRKPSTQFKPLNIKGVKYKVYEVKRNRIRIYLFHQEKTGHIVVTGGFKNEQDDDINQLKNILKNYYDEQQ